MTNGGKEKLENMLHLYRIFKKITVKERIALLDLLKDEGCDYLCEGVHNFLSNVPLSKKNRNEIKRKLKGKKKTLKYLSDRTNDVKLRKDSLKQTGAGLGLILASVLPLLASLIRSQ